MISIVVPAYQEESRVGQTIRALSAYLESQDPGAEIILVCDGCTDRTAEVATAAFSAPSCRLHVIELARNKGKGHAVRAGVEKASGEYVFFTDADLAFAPDLIREFVARLAAGADVVIAQRRPGERYAGTPRRALGAVSRALVGGLVLPGIPDSQAGFKGFTRHAALDLFSRLTIQRFLFDLEILVMARRRHYRIETVAVDWRDRPGSTVRLVADSLGGLRDLLLILFRKLAGRYR